MNYKLSPEQVARIVMYYNPSARAVISGSIAYPNIFGEVYFYNVQDGVLVVVVLENLPDTPSDFFGFHLHEGDSCTGNAQDNFANAGRHYNPNALPHPQHSGDFPPILARGGSGFLAFVTNRFTVPEIIGKTVIIHSMPDDFKTQPSGDSGEKIACGIIKE